MQEIVFVNGEFVARADAKVSVEDRGYQFGDGIYEVIRFHGRRGLRLEEHLDRLTASADHLRIKNAPSKAEWLDVIKHLLEKCGIRDDETEVNTLYQQVTRGDLPRNHVFPKQPVPPGAVAYFRRAPVYEADVRSAGIALSSQPDERWSRCYIKSICLLPVVLAKQAAVDAGAFEALLVRDRIATEGGSTNSFCIIKGELHTHPEGGHILSGITRKMVLEAAAIADVPVIERPVPIEEFRAAEEAFISSTTLDIMPATKLDHEPIGDGQVGPVTKKLMDALADIVHDEIRRPVSA